ncbi:MAG TPA: hypothetical protein VFY63_10755 [Pseudorhizobium sp.]|nr:hypothetical protein [Pseudorhizobium sp.]
MRQREIIFMFAMAMAVYVLAVFLWPSSVGEVDKTARLAGTPQETAFLHERFGVPAPEQQVSRVE